MDLASVPMDKKWSTLLILCMYSLGLRFSALKNDWLTFECRLPKMQDMTKKLWSSSSVWFVKKNNCPFE
jgi:hypothetical protein